ncbi:uncharacterized protein B0P05DRAFT_564563 [Gilbertella persicaria]|uniref:Vacuolar membrane protein n=1 Tax=Rhizopus stolonifer TaxID=4846 RepID=A0A367KQE0_RHIST|nr:uncharacterized protein B0P05DRAFT_564563 [Gilbertella persicaria]KAI8048348.1 hypothetical protein B0P05DRAFT_564563 [Gilbertella persicaria]RCI04082.1 hypothetical protein CU098_008739 [Rhizopus stolonifer]
MGCCSSDKPKWKREIVHDHRFQNVNLNAFYMPNCTSRLGYCFVFLASLKSFAVYVADLWTAVSLLVIGQTTATPAIPTEISKWIFFACIIVSFLLLLWDMYKANRILATDNIALAFTSVITNRYLSMKDYRYYCLFQSINHANSKGIERYAFFIFFQLKGWKRLLLAEAPRQVINVVTLEALIPEWLKIRNGQVSFDNGVLGETVIQQILTITMAFSVVVFAISFVLVCAAAVLYIPLLCHIRGNLKEYCCHKVDKRIATLLNQGPQYRMAKRGNKKYARVPENESYIEENYFQRPLAVNNISSPAISSFEKSSYASRTTDTSQDHLLNNTIDLEYRPRPVANHFPYGHRPVQSYTPKLSHTIGSPTMTSPELPQATPSFTCINEQYYQNKNYPYGY